MFARGRLAALRRDLTMLVAPFVGARPRPFSRRAAPLPTASPLAPRALRIAKVVRETPSAISLWLEDPTGAPIPFSAGQFFTLLVPVGGNVHKRAYSASSSPLEPGRVSVTIKRVAGGLVSNHLVDEAREGAMVNVLGPSGSFVPAAATGPRHLALFAGGSGITPMMAIVRALLATEPETRITLVYGSRSEAEIIFAEALAALEKEHAPRFAVRHVIGEAMDRARVSAELETLGDADEHFLCGPTPMMDEVLEALAARGVPAGKVRQERFVSPHLREAAKAPAGPADVTLRVKGKERHLVVSGQTILEAGLDAGEPMPFSCAMGGCGACKVKLVSGDVVMDEPVCLTDEERAGGYVLACVARPCGPAVVEVE